MARASGVSRAAIVLTLLTAGSQALGLIRDAVIAAVFGAGAALDAYLVALGLINLVFTLIAAAMSRAVVPALTRAVRAGDSARANRTLQVALTAALAVLISGSAVMYVAAQMVVDVLAPGFDADTAALAVELTRILLVATVVVAGTDILAAAAQANGRFLFSGLQGIGFNLVMIAAALWFGPRFGVQALALGYVLGSLVRLLLQLPPLWAIGWQLRPRLRWRDTDFRQVLVLLPALMMTSAVANVNTLVDRAVGSDQGVGVITALSFGWRIVTLINTLLVLTLAAAIFPAFSANAETQRRADLRALVQRALRVMLVLLVPVTAFLVLAAEPVVAVIFGRGAFTVDDITLTSVAVTGYALGATALGLRTITARACLALGDSRATLVTALIIMTTNVIGDLTLGVTYGVAGLAASTSASIALGLIVLLGHLSRRHQAIDLPDLARSIVRVLTAAGAALLITYSLGLPNRLIGAGTPRATSLAILVLTGLVLLAGYYGTLRLLRSPEMRDLTHLLRQQTPRLPFPRRGGTSP